MEYRVEEYDRAGRLLAVTLRTPVYREALADWRGDWVLRDAVEKRLVEGETPRLTRRRRRP